MIECHESTFLMTPAQRWAANARRRNRPDLAQHHESLARRVGAVRRRAVLVHRRVSTSTTHWSSAVVTFMMRRRPRREVARIQGLSGLALVNSTRQNRRAEARALNSAVRLPTTRDLV